MDGVTEVKVPINNNKSKNIPISQSLNNEEKQQVKEESKDGSRLKIRAEASENSSLMTQSKRFGALRDSQRNYFRRD